MLTSKQMELSRARSLGQDVHHAMRPTLVTYMPACTTVPAQGKSFAWPLDHCIRRPSRLHQEGHRSRHAWSCRGTHIKIKADTGHHQMGGLFLRISQNNEVCTVVASMPSLPVASAPGSLVKLLRTPFVSGSNLLGVWVLPEEYRKIGLFWEMESNRCFRINVVLWKSTVS